MAMDYSGINYDYNDNVYVVTNLKPFSGPSVPTGLTAIGNGISLNWNDNTEANLAGYNVYRSTTSGGTYTKLNAALVSTSDYVDTTAPVGVVSYYQVTAVDSSSNESAPASTNATRPSSDVTPPAAPSGVTPTPSQSGIAIDWADNVEPDLAGYN